MLSLLNKKTTNWTLSQKYCLYRNNVLKCLSKTDFNQNLPLEILIKNNETNISIHILINIYAKTSRSIFIIFYLSLVGFYSGPISDRLLEIVKMMNEIRYTAINIIFMETILYVLTRFLRQKERSLPLAKLSHTGTALNKEFRFGSAQNLKINRSKICSCLA